MIQQTLFDGSDLPAVTVPYVRGSETSKAAAEKIAVSNGGKFGKREKILLNWMQARESYGVTHSEVKTNFGWEGDYERPAMNNLKSLGYVEKTNRKRENEKKNGCEIWIATPAGMNLEIHQ